MASVRQTIDEKFKEEQLEILAALIKIIGIVPNQKDSYIDRPELEAKKEEIEALFPKIKKYHTSHVWISIKDESPNRFMSIIRNVLKHHNYSLCFKSAALKDNDVIIYRTRYTIKGNLA